MKDQENQHTQDDVEGDMKSDVDFMDSSDSQSNRNTTAQTLLPQTKFDELYMYQRPTKKTIYTKIKDSGKDVSLKQTFFSVFPIFKWIRSYSWKEDFIHDVISGFTVAIMHIPQGMAYSMLGGVPPIVGIYMAFFPILIYVFMGTSRHISMGTFAVVCMMTGKVVAEYSHPVVEDDISIAVGNDTTENPSLVSDIIQRNEYTPIQVATCVCLVVGLWQLFLGIFKLGGLSVLLSETLVSGFTTGAAVHVATSQVKHLFGIKVARYSGPMKIIYTYIDLFRKIGTTNLISMAIALSMVIILIICNEVIKPAVGNRLPVPIPFELMAVVLGTIASTYGEFGPNYNVTVVGNIPTGLPEPAVPPVNLILNVLVDGLIISIVSFSINMSMASLFARKLNYKIDGNQELLASGTSNIFGSFFSCIPFAASLSRSLIQENAGGRTQMASIVSCSFLLVVLLWIGPFFEPLPQCVLAAIVVVSLKGMFIQVKDLVTIWHKSVADGLVWLITFVSVVVIDIDIGLGIGISLSILTLVLHGQKVKVFQMGSIPGTDIYLHIDHYQAALEIPRVRILQIAGGIHFANREYVKSKFFSALEENAESGEYKIAYVILDMSCISFLDPAATKTLLSMYHDLSKKNVILFLANCSVGIREKLLHQDFFNTFPEKHVFPFIHNAVMHIQHSDGE